jgi:hypothetical protein
MRKLVAAIVAALALSAASPASAELLFSDGTLWSIADDGTSRTSLGVEGLDPSWAPDGERFVVVREIEGEFSRDDRSELAVGRVGNPALVALAGGAELRDPAWSPDGTTIAAVRLVPPANDQAAFQTELVLLPADGGQPRVLAGGAYFRAPAWSPDGLEIAVTRTTFDPERGFGDSALIAVRTLDGAQRQLAGSGGTPAWSPDGTRVVFATSRDRNGETCFHECSPNNELYMVNADGSGERRLTTTEGDEQEPAWSPDGTRIAFASDRHYPDSRAKEIWVMDADGGCATQLTFGPERTESPAWRPGRVPVGRGPCGSRPPYHDVVDVSRYAVRDTLPLYPGRSFEGMLLTDAERGLLIYDDCDLPDPARCAGELQLQVSTSCTTHPAKYDIPGHPLRMRGALVMDYHDSVDVYSGGTVTRVFGVRSHARLRRLIAALRPISGPENLDRRLARPRLPRRVWRALRRSRAIRKDPIIIPKRALVKSDRAVLRAMRRFGSRKRPACDR